MVGDVRDEVGVAAVGLAHHAVLVVAEVGGAQPQRAVLLVGVAARREGLHHRVHAAVGVQAGFQVVDVELDAEGLQVGVLLAAQRRHGEHAHGFEVRDVAAPGDEGARDLLDVFAAVAVLGPAGLARLHAARARLHREREVVDLRAGVVVVELARDRVALRFEERGERIAERGLATMAHVQRAGGVRRDELDHHLLRIEGLAPAVRGAFREHARHGFLPGLWGEAKVDEARARNLHAVHVRVGGQCGREFRGELARAGAQALGELECDVAGEIAVRRLAWALDQHLGVRRLRRDLHERRAHQVGEMGAGVHAGPRF